MPQPCPDCQIEGRVLPGVSAEARVDYYRCDQCGQVWTTPKGQQAPLERITRKVDRESSLRAPGDDPSVR
jgi:uncharacterized Zn finger protein